MSKKIRGSIFLLLAALIWGTAFVAQSEAMNYVTPFVFNSVRALIGGVVLIPVALIFRKTQRKDAGSGDEKLQIKQSVIGGIWCGIIYCFASTLQQFGISMTSAGKAGFVTALYIVIVPLLGVFIGRKIPKIMWLCVAAAMAGFWLLCVNEGFYVSTGDLLVLGCAFFYSLHIMTIDHFNAKGVDCVLMSCVQFLFGGTVMLFPAAIIEKFSFEGLWQARVELLYAAVFSCGAAFTLQMFGQKDCPPTAATLLMSLESVFAALSGWIILDERLSGKELAGCALVFAAVICAQLPLPEIAAGLKKKHSER